MTLQGFVKRAQRIRAYVGETGIAANKARLRELILGLARPATASLLPFAEFRALIEQFHYGIVFTAHPTFSMPHALGCLLAKLASGADDGRRPLNGSEVDAIVEEARGFSHRPPDRHARRRIRQRARCDRPRGRGGRQIARDRARCRARALSARLVVACAASRVARLLGRLRPRRPLGYRLGRHAADTPEEQTGAARAPDQALRRALGGLSGLAEPRRRSS